MKFSGASKRKGPPTANGNLSDPNLKKLRTDDGVGDGTLRKDGSLTNPNEKENACRDPAERFPPKIEFGCYEIETWYSSPYPEVRSAKS